MEFAAHIRPADQAVQTVAAHCLETAALAERYGAAVGMPQTAALAGAVHDIGKLTSDCNHYIRGETDFRRGELDHSFAGAKYLQAIADQSGNPGLTETAALIARTVLSHHGLHDWVNDDARDAYQQRIGKETYYEEIVQNLRNDPFLPDIPAALRAAAGELKPVRAKLQAMAAGAAEKAEAYAFYLGMLERLLQSILIDADRTNTADFMSDAQTEAKFDTVQIWKDMRRNMEAKLAAFAARTDPVSLQRKSISARCAAFASHDVGICRLIVPTGGGKTLSSLRFAIEYANTHPIDKIIYIAPFMSILEQNSDVIRQIAGEGAFLEHHSNLLAEVSGDEDRLHEYELRTEKWDSPVIATTMVQFLNALFAGAGSAVRRMHRLSRAVIIVDEVQSIPLKCIYLFNLAMNFLSRVCGSTVVLCTATQPPLEQCNEFPLMLDEDSSMTGDTAADFAVLRRTELIYQPKTGGYSYDEAAGFCRRKFAENGSLLLVVNTKASARELYQRLRETAGAKVYHLSTGMCPQHRRDRISEMKAALESQEPVICVTTQLIEAGVDISFGCVVRALAGMDNAAQAAGRCNRNGEQNRVCPVYVLYLYEERLGSLAEIREAQKISQELFELPADTDFLGVLLMSGYYQKLYQNAANRDHRNLLRYPLKDSTDRDLINLLALNRERRQVMPDLQRKKLKYRAQAFKTAGSRFAVIDANTTEVLVPYNAEAEALIAALGSGPDPKEAVRLLRQAQKYAVSMYDGFRRRLGDEAAIHTLTCGQSCTVPVLEKRFYDADLGVTAEGGAHEVLLM